MIKLGDYNTLRIKKRTDYGLYLDGGEEGNILLPNRYVPEHYTFGEEIEVFCSSTSTKTSASWPPPSTPLPRWASLHGWSVHGPTSMAPSSTGA